MMMAGSSAEVSILENCSDADSIDGQNDLAPAAAPHTIRRCL